MRRVSLLFLVALVVAVLITPSRAMAATPSVRGLPAPSKGFSTLTTFNGRVVAKNTATNYFVLSFKCSEGTLTIADWTYEVSSTQSFTGTLGPSALSCGLVSTTSGVSYTTTAIPLYFNSTPVNNPSTSPSTSPPQATLTLSFTNIVASKTYFGKFVSSTTGDCTSPPSMTNPTPPCVAVQTSDGKLIIPTTPTSTQVDPFVLVGASTSTLNLSAQ